MDPILFELAWTSRSVSVSAYPVALLLATATAAGSGWVSAVRAGLSGRRVTAVLAVALAGIFIGARLLYVVLHRSVSADTSSLGRLQLESFSLHGALFGGLVGGWIACRIASLSLPRFVDAVAIPALLGLAIVRLGCWLNGCCFGSETSLPWGIAFPAGSLPHVAQLLAAPGLPLHSPRPLHPTQLYEIGAAMLSIGVAVVGRPCRPGQRFLNAFTTYLLALAGIFLVRGDLPLIGVNVWTLESLNGILLMLAVSLRLRLQETPSQCSARDSKAGD